VLASTALRHDCDIVGRHQVRRRWVCGDGLGSSGRVFASSYATRLVKDLFPRRLAMVSDPLSGLFAFRRASVNLDRLRPAGFKVLLEILVRNPGARVPRWPTVSNRARRAIPRLRCARGSRSCGT